MPKIAWNNLRVLVPLLILSQVALDCVAILGFPQLQTHRQREFVLVTLTFSQISLLAVWLVLGRGTGVARVALLLASACLLAHSFLETLRTDIGVFYVLELLAVLNVISLLSLRFRGFCLAVPGSMTDAPSVLPQYSLSRLMGWMTSVALIGLFLRVLPQRPERTLWFLMVLTPFAVTTCLACRAAFSEKPLARRLAVSSLAAFALGGIPGALHDAYRHYSLDVAAACLAHGVLLTGYLWIFRVAGYRLIRSERRSSAPESIAA